jgi:hypothetical protein
VRIGGILAVLSRRDGRGSANFRDLYASRLISVAADCTAQNALKKAINMHVLSRSSQKTHRSLNFSSNKVPVVTFGKRKIHLSGISSIAYAQKP